MFSFSSHLGPKLILTTLVFLLGLATATALLVTQGFRQTQNNATQRSKEGLEVQGRSALLKMTHHEADLSTNLFHQAVITAQQGAQYFVSMAEMGGSLRWDSRRNLSPGATGGFYDLRPERRSDIWMPNSIKTIDAKLGRALRDSANLDPLVPSLLTENPDFVAIYHISEQGMTRYYPPVGVHKIIPPDLIMTDQPFYGPATPSLNPERKTLWTAPYIDPAGQGMIVSVVAPIYQGDEFRGVIAVDITLKRLIDHLNSLKPVKDGNGFAFLVDRNGRLIAAPSPAISQLMNLPLNQSMSITETLGLNLTLSKNAEFRGILASMQRGEHDTTMTTIGGKPSFISYAPLPSIGWSLGIVAPVNEVIAESAKVEAEIRKGTDATVQDTLLLMLLFFSLALLGTIVISRRLTQPIAALVAGTRLVAAGRLDVTIPVSSRDELGLLAESFNQMIAKLAAYKQRMETWNQTLERTVQERTADLAAAMQEAQEARAAAEQANELKTQFLANMSHELRTPLNSIINFTRILMSGMRGPVSEAQADYLNRVRNSGEHLLGLINDILDLSKIEAGKMELFKEPLNIGELVHSVMSSAAGLIKGKPIELCHEIAADLPTIEADRTRVRQILLNLLSNAAKFTDEGTITVQVVRQERQVLISVRDTGIGISPEHQALIFEEFRQVEGASNRRYEGTGLGLAICRRLIELHGGRIWLESQPGTGSTFSFTLPFVSAAQPALLAEPAVLADLKGASILVIDDDAAAVEIISSYLSRDGHAVCGVTDSRQALEEARRLKPAAIILDVLMPHKDGWEILTALKADPELKLVPVVLYSIMEEQKLGFYLGANAYLTKPIDEDQLRGTVARLVGSGSTILVIDDDPDALEIVSQQLRQLGRYNILTVAGGRAGLEQIDRTPPDLLILDLMMPEVDGFAVLEQLEASAATRTIPVVVLTAKDLSSQERAWLNQRVNGLLCKGLTSAGELLEKVSELLASVTHDPAQP
jgi:signal transduction histidine kinase/CheY-like chemotaxis protein